MIRESVERRARELMADLPLSAEDWAEIIDQAARVLHTVASLDDLPLETVEPAAVYNLAAENSSPPGAQV